MRTELPEKWCIQLGDNYNIINNWGRGYWGPTTGWGDLMRKKYMFCNFKEKRCSSSDTRWDFEEITFEEFKYLVLKEPILQPTYEIY